MYEAFLDASSHLFKRVSPSIGLSVGPFGPLEPHFRSFEPQVGALLEPQVGLFEPQVGPFEPQVRVLEPQVRSAYLSL